LKSGGQLAPVGEAHDVGAGLEPGLGGGEPQGHPVAPAARVAVVAQELGVVFGVQGGAALHVLRGRGLVGAVTADHAAAAVGWVGDESVDGVGEGGQDVQAVAVVEGGLAEGDGMGHWRQEWAAPHRKSVGEREADACAGQGQRRFKDVENRAGLGDSPHRLSKGRALRSEVVDVFQHFR
jgi:hypothetical protein